MNVLSQWKTTLHCNVISHCLGAYTKACMFRRLICNGQWSPWSWDTKTPRCTKSNTMVPHTLDPEHRQAWYWPRLHVISHYPSIGDSLNYMMHAHVTALTILFMVMFWCIQLCFSQDIILMPIWNTTFHYSPHILGSQLTMKLSYQPKTAGQEITIVVWR